MRLLKWFGILWPVLLLLVPSVYDAPVRDTGAVEAVDTTYASGVYAALMPGVTDTLVQGADTLVRLVPDPDSMGGAEAYLAVRQPSGKTFLVLSYDALAATIVDSTQVDSVWAVWGLGSPYAYALNVPGTPPTSIDTAGALIHANYEGYETVEDLDADPFWTFITPTAEPVIGGSPGGEVIIDTTEAYPGLTHSVRHEWTYVDTANFCESRTLDHAYRYPGYESNDYNEMWVEVAVRFDTLSSAAAPQWIDCADGSSGHAWKQQQISLNVSQGYGRWQFTMDCSTRNYEDHCFVGDNPYAIGGSPESDGVVGTVKPADINLYNGEWRLFRYYVRMATDSLTADGTQVWWVDTTQVLPGYGSTDPDILHHTTALIGIRALSLGRNKDYGGYWVPEADTPSIANPWVEKAWIGYSTVWVAPDTPSWFYPLMDSVPRPGWRD